MAFMIKFSNDQSRLWFVDTSTNQKVAVDGAPNYATKHNPKDSLHAVLDSLDPNIVSMLFDMSDVFLNPNNARAQKSLSVVSMVMNF
jgi:hypothetical protein